MNAEVTMLEARIPTRPVAPGIDQLDLLLERLPDWIQQLVLEHQFKIEDVIMELGRPLRFNLKSGFKRFSEIIRKDELEHLKFALNDIGLDNRSGLDGTLHRISVRRRRARGGEGTIVGAIVRLARVARGVAEPLRPYLERGNFLLMGPPKMGKTTALRDCVRILAERLGPRLIVVDSNSELGGFSDVPHEIIGDAVRLQVPGPEFQEKIITEAIANWSAEMIILDEIKRIPDALALEEGSKTGVRFGATVHAWTLQEALERPAYQPLFGNVDLKTRSKPTRSSFDTIIEIKARGEYLIYENGDEVISKVLAGKNIEGIRVQQE
jgi:stage III sporulation protein SpoIIIAA